MQSSNKILQPVGEKIKRTYSFQCALSKMSKMSRIMSNITSHHWSTRIILSYRLNQDHISCWNIQ